MNTKQKLILLPTIILSLSSQAYAGMTELELGYMNWSDNATDYFGKAKDNNEWILIRGETGTDFGDVYAHVKLEDFLDDNMVGSEINVAGQIHLTESGFNLYGQVFAKLANNWSETNMMLGLSHDRFWDNGIHTQVAVAVDYVTSDYALVGKGDGSQYQVNGFNGGYIWLSLDKNFDFLDQKFGISWFQENYFLRGDEYLEVAGDMNDFGINGRLAVSYFISESVSTSLQYRYYNNNGGKSGFHDGIFYSIVYSF